MSFGRSTASTLATARRPGSNVYAEQVDRKVFPLLYDYLNRLPDGLNSHPGCQVTADFAARLQQQYANLWTDPRLPLPLRTALQEPWKPNAFISIVLVTCQTLVLRDHLGMGEEAYLKFTTPMTWSVLNSPFYRTALRMMSPNLLLLNVSRRWNKFVRGTDLTSVETHRASHRLLLTAPANLYVNSWYRFYGATFEGILHAARATDAKVALRRVSDTQTHFDLEWKR